jgi:hypothetical protein
MNAIDCCSRRARVAGLIVLAALSAGIMLGLVSPIAQDPAYHRFADQRAWLGVPNFLNVISNLPLVIVGGAGTVLVLRRTGQWPSSLRSAWGVTFVGVLLTGLGSAYYHLRPDNSSLVWDRLPMAIGFMGFLAAMIGDRVSLRAAAMLLAPFVAAGIGSVVWWWWTESRGAGDLRPYALVQFFPLVGGLYLAALLPGGRIGLRPVVFALAWYAGAKVFEVLDGPIGRMGVGDLAISGHTLKHIAAAAGTWWLLRGATPTSTTR